MASSPSPVRTPGRSDEDLRVAAKHVGYEMRMLFNASIALQMLRFDLSRVADLTIQNALVESFAVHARAVLHFFYPVNPHKDDVIAEHFFTDQSLWVKHRPPLTPTLENVRDKANIQVAHISYRRTEFTGDKKLWMHGQITVDIYQVLDVFRQYARSELLPRGLDIRRDKNNPSIFYLPVITTGEE